MKNGLKYGALSGIFLGILILALHRLIPGIFFGAFSSIVILLVVAIVAMVTACRKEKQELGGILKFGEGLLTGITCFAVLNLIYTLSMWALINFSPEAFELLNSYSITSSEEFMRKMGTPEDKIFEQMENFKNIAAESKKLSVNLINWAVFSLVFGGPLALIISGIMSRKNSNQKIQSE